MALPPGLNGYVLAQQQQAQQQAQQLSMLSQLAQLKGAEEDRSMKRQMMPLQIQQQQAALAKLLQDAEQAKAKAQFFSPENRQQYMTPARPAIMPDPQEAQQSADYGTPAVAPVPAQAGGMDFGRFLQDAASRGVVNPEVYANHVAQQEQRRTDSEQRAALARESVQSRETIAREANQARFDAARMRAEDQAASQAERIAARREMMHLAASLRQPPQPRNLQLTTDADGNQLIVNPDGTTRALSSPDGAPVRKPGTERAMPASAVRALMENQQNLRKAESALTLLQGAPGGDPNATGWKGMLAGTEIGDQVLQRADPKGVNTRAAIADLGSMIIHDRSGAAVTAAEYPRLRPFIPKVTDDADTAKKKLQRFVTEYRHVQQESVDFFTESGYKVPVNSLRPPVTPTSGPIQAPQQRRASDAAPVLRFDAQGNPIR